MGKLGGLVHLCSSPLPCGGSLAALVHCRVNLALPELRGSRQEGKQSNLFVCLCAPPHSLFPLSSLQLQTGRQLQFGSLQKIPAWALVLNPHESLADTHIHGSPLSMGTRTRPPLHPNFTLCLKSAAESLTPAALPCSSLDRPCQLWLAFKRQGGFL